MAEFNELIKKFDKIRDYMREFYIYGFKSREELALKSLRSYDDDKRRIESYLTGYMSFNQRENGKNIFLSVDSRKITENPLYKVFKTKSFTKNDITLHFIILDILSRNEKFTLREITDKINNDYFSKFRESNILDTATIRLKLSEYVKEGILKSEKNGKEVYYNFFDVDIDILNYKDTISFFSEVSPIGVIGSFIMDRFEIRNMKFSFKHNYILHAMESEILYKILEGLNKKSKIELEYFMKKDKKYIVKKITPLKIFVSVQTGRRYIVGYLETGSVFTYRLDKIKDVKVLEKDENFIKLQNEIENKLQYLWGVSFKKNELETLKIVLYIGKKEEYIVERLRNEGRHGIIKQLTSDKWEYQIEVYDALEMLPWIRTFIGRIISLESTNEDVCRKFYRDFESVYRFYDGGKNDIQRNK